MNEHTLKNAIKLAVAADFISCMIRDIKGIHVADTYKGKPLKDDVVQEIAIAALSDMIKDQRGVKQDVI